VSPPGRLLAKNIVDSSADIDGPVSLSEVLTGEFMSVGVVHAPVKFALSVIHIS
jgi:hypothetical protein